MLQIICFFFSTLCVIILYFPLCNNILLFLVFLTAHISHFSTCLPLIQLLSSFPPSITLSLSSQPPFIHATILLSSHPFHFSLNLSTFPVSLLPSLILPSRLLVLPSPLDLSSRSPQTSSSPHQSISYHSLLTPPFLISFSFTPPSTLQSFSAHPSTSPLSFYHHPSISSLPPYPYLSSPQSHLSLKPSSLIPIVPLFPPGAPLISLYFAFFIPVSSLFQLRSLICSSSIFSLSHSGRYYVTLLLGARLFVM